MDQVVTQGASSPTLVSQAAAPPTARPIISVSTQDPDLSKIHVSERVPSLRANATAPTGFGQRHGPMAHRCALAIRKTWRRTTTLYSAYQSSN
jgi:hypothetical protein